MKSKYRLIIENRSFDPFNKKNKELTMNVDKKNKGFNSIDDLVKYIKTNKLFKKLGVNRKGSSTKIEFNNIIIKTEDSVVDFSKINEDKWFKNYVFLKFVEDKDFEKYLDIQRICFEYLYESFEFRLDEIKFLNKKSELRESLNIKTDGDTTNNKDLKDDSVLKSLFKSFVEIEGIIQDKTFKCRDKVNIITLNKLKRILY